MNDDLNELLDDTLDTLLLNYIVKHVPNDERIGIFGMAYFSGPLRPARSTRTSTTDSHCSRAMTADHSAPSPR